MVEIRICLAYGYGYEKLIPSVELLPFVHDVKSSRCLGRLQVHALSANFFSQYNKIVTAAIFPITSLQVVRLHGLHQVSQNLPVRLRTLSAIS